jgi:hypothetical protein
VGGHTRTFATIDTALKPLKFLNAGAEIQNRA